MNVGTRAAIPGVPGLLQSEPLTHVEALELDYIPEHLIVLGGGYVGLEFAQPMRRFGSAVTIVEQGPQLVAQEDSDVAQALMQASLSCEAHTRESPQNPWLNSYRPPEPRVFPVLRTDLIE